ncbi:hypothetical protein AGMMS49938_00400 [Fibrobacterales bacterium]|nr:hypothetical protein AGMMS49938_00400 [Fibrobacterales bacterium]
MKYLFLTVIALLFTGCIDEYSDSITLEADGSAVFEASIYPCGQDSNLVNDIKKNYGSVAGVKLDSVWFSQRDTGSAVNFRISFDNLLTWKDEQFDKDFVGSLSLQKNDSLKNRFSFKRVLNPNAESEDGAVIPEESVDSFALEQLNGDDSSFWEHSLTLPKGAILLNSEPIDTASVVNENGFVKINWKIPVTAVASKRVVLSADFELPSTETSVHWTSLAAIGASCLIMLLAIWALIRRLKKLSVALKELKDKERKDA